jgi:hypothetical protein
LSEASARSRRASAGPGLDAKHLEGLEIAVDQAQVRTRLPQPGGDVVRRSDGCEDLDGGLPAPAEGRDDDASAGDLGVGASVGCQPRSLWRRTGEDLVGARPFETDALEHPAAIAQLHGVGDDVTTEPRHDLGRRGRGDVQPEPVSAQQHLEVRDDPTLGRQQGGVAAGARGPRFQPGDVVRDHAVEPARGVGAGHLDHAAVQRAKQASSPARRSRGLAPGHSTFPESSRGGP